MNRHGEGKLEYVHSISQVLYSFSTFRVFGKCFSDCAFDLFGGIAVMKNTETAHIWIHVTWILSKSFRIRFTTLSYVVIDLIQVSHQNLCFSRTQSDSVQARIGWVPAAAFLEKSNYKSWRKEVEIWRDSAFNWYWARCWRSGKTRGNISQSSSVSNYCCNLQSCS